jgi:hypothetical protein
MIQRRRAQSRAWILLILAGAASTSLDCTSSSESEVTTSTSEVTTSTSQAFTHVWPDPNHQEITREALAFLKPAVLAQVVESNINVDKESFTFAPWHFDGCFFIESRDHINDKLYQSRMALTPNSSFDSLTAQTQFGRALHTVQDFYSHSNWVELRQRLPSLRELVDPGLGYWSLVSQPYGNVVGVENVLVVEGRPPKDLGPVKRTPPETPWPDSGLVTIGSSSSERYGLVSGKFHKNECPHSASLSHTELNKDHKARDGFSEAKNLAIKQTSHEWCRLMAMVSVAYGADGVAKLCGSWVQEVDGANAACPMLQVDALCPCPDATPVMNPETRICEPCPDDAPRWNSEQKSCEACPVDAPRWNSEQKVCEPCPVDAPKWNSEQKVCEPCPVDAPKWNSEQKVCEPCPVDAPKWNPQTKMCEPCADGLQWNPTTRQCEPCRYLDTSLTACPDGQNLGYFWYWLDTPEFRADSWCGAAQKDIDWANANDPVTWRIPYLLETCIAGVSWTYSHAFPDGTRYYSPPNREINLDCCGTP